MGSQGATREIHWDVTIVAARQQCNKLKNTNLLMKIQNEK